MRDVVAPSTKHSTADNTGNIIRFPVAEATGSSAIGLSRDYADLTDRVNSLGEELAEGHRRALQLEWYDRTSRNAQKPASSLLEVLSVDHGLSWTAIARMLGISVQALRKWRLGESPSGENHSRIAALVAFLEVLRSFGELDDPASWMEIPILPDVPLTPIDAYVNGAFPQILELSRQKIPPELALDYIDPDWRQKYRESGWEVFDAGDGNFSVGAKKRDQG
jgi:hypothetical protein